MRRRLGSFGLAVALWTARSSAMAQSEASVTAWQTDIDSLAARIHRIHPRPWLRTSETAFDAGARALRETAPRADAGTMLVGMLRLVASIEDGHTEITDFGPAAGSWYPVRFYVLADGLWISGADSAHARLAGAKVTRVGTVSADSAMRTFESLVSADNTFGRRDPAAIMSNAVLLRALGITHSDSLILQTSRGPATLAAVTTGKGTADWWQYGEITGPPGTHLVTAFGGRTDARYRNPTENADLPLHLRGRRAYWWTALPGDSAVYFALNNMVSKSGFSPNTLMQELRAALGQVDARPHLYQRFILDMRYNSGGDGSLVPALVNEFVKRDSTINRPGRFFVITSGKTFSAAADCVLDLLRHTSVVLVGEPMGVPYNGSGDPGRSVLPGNKIEISISTNSRSTSSLDSIRVVPVQLPAPMAGEEYFAGRDPALAAILDAPTPQPTVAGVLDREGGAAARKLWTTQNAKYGGYTWWQPFTWEQLNALSYRLLEAKRSDDALAGFTINTERYPTRWEPWDSLGDAYRAVGRRAEARDAYSRALALAPDNWNAEAERRAIRELGASSP